MRAGVARPRNYPGAESRVVYMIMLAAALSGTCAGSMRVAASVHFGMRITRTAVSPPSAARFLVGHRIPIASGGGFHHQSVSSEKPPRWRRVLRKMRNRMGSPRTPHSELLPRNA